MKNYQNSMKSSTPARVALFMEISIAPLSRSEPRMPRLDFHFLFEWIQGSDSIRLIKITPIHKTELPDLVLEVYFVPSELLQ